MKFLKLPEDLAQIKDVLSKIDYSNALIPNCTDDLVAKTCDEALQYQFAAVAVFPSCVKEVARRLEGSKVHSQVAVGFPMGNHMTQTKLTEDDPARHNIDFWRSQWKRTHIQGVIVNCGDGGAQFGAAGIAVVIDAPDTENTILHDGIEISRNIIKGCPGHGGCGIAVRNARNVKIHDNTVERCAETVSTYSTENISIR